MSGIYINITLELQTSSQMRVDAHVTGRTAQTLPLPVRNVLLRLRVSVLLGHAEVDDVDN